MLPPTGGCIKGNSFQQLDPRTRLAWLGAWVLVCATTSQVALLTGLVAVIFALSWATRQGLRGCLPLTKAAFSLGIGVVLLQSILLTSGEVLFRIGPVAFYSAGLWLGVLVTLRLYAILVGFLQFATWTEPAELSLVLIKVGLPYRYAMLGTLALRFFPVIEKELAGVFAAQAARGLELDGALRKALAFGPILLPFCLRSLHRANEVALAMEIRAFGLSTRRTFTREINLQVRDYSAMAVLALLLVVYFAL